MSSETQQQLTQLLSELESTQGQRRDPQLAYLTELLRRARSQRESVASRLLQKARLQWQSVKTTPIPKPSASPDTANESQQRSALAPLLERLTIREQAPDRSATGMELDEYLKQQDRQGDEDRAATAPASAPQPELRAARRLRQRLAAEHTARLLHTALEESPESPGPLNPQMLATRALTTMRELSPQYFNRFVGYIDNLLYIEQCRNLAGDAPVSEKTAKRKTPKRSNKPSS